MDRDAHATNARLPAALSRFKRNSRSPILHHFDTLTSLPYPNSSLKADSVSHRLGQAFKQSAMFSQHAAVLGRCLLCHGKSLLRAGRSGQSPRRKRQVVLKVGRLLMFIGPAQAIFTRRAWRWLALFVFAWLAVPDRRRLFRRRPSSPPPSRCLRFENARTSEPAPSDFGVTFRHYQPLDIIFTRG